MAPAERRRPTNRSHLEKLISEVAKRDGVAPARLRRWISQMVIAGALARVANDDDRSPLVAIKGGVTMELRFGLHARATKDLDAVASASRNAAEQVLRDSLEQPYEGFSFQVAPLEEMAGVDAFRRDVKLAYESRSWSTERLDLSLSTGPIETELLPAIDLSAFGLDGPAEITSLSLRYQIAQKLHAATTPWEDRENPRFRDVVDLLLLLGVAGDFVEVRAACVEVFEARTTHDWPPVLVAHESWHEPYRALASELGVEPVDLDTALQYLRGLVERIDNAK